jgi:hypothetical protein
VKGQVWRGNPGQCQPNEDFYLYINGRNGTETNDDLDECAISIRLDDLGNFYFYDGMNDVIMRTVSKCPPDTHVNSVALKELCLYRIPVSTTTTTSSTTTTTIKESKIDCVELVVKYKDCIAGESPPDETCAGTDDSCGNWPNCVDCNVHDRCENGMFKDSHCFSLNSGSQLCAVSSYCTENCCDQYYGDNRAYCSEGLCRPPSTTTTINTDFNCSDFDNPNGGPYEYPAPYSEILRQRDIAGYVVDENGEHLDACTGPADYGGGGYQGHLIEYWCRKDGNEFYAWSSTVSCSPGEVCEAVEVNGKMAAECHPLSTNSTK